MKGGSREGRALLAIATIHSLTLIGPCPSDSVLAFLVIAITLLTCLACQTRPYACSAAALPCRAARSVCFAPDNIMGVQEEVQLREQDFGNFQVGGFEGEAKGCRSRSSCARGALAIYS